MKETHYAPTLSSSKTAIVLALTLAVVGVGCGARKPKTPEEALVFASEDLTAAREEIVSATRTLEKRETAVVAAEKKLKKYQRYYEDSIDERDRSQVELQNARRAEELAKARVAETATDEALFRVVSKKLLDDKTLAGSAISATAVNGSVRLEGTVPDATTKEHASKVVRAALGVTSVDNRLTVGRKMETGF